MKNKTNIISGFYRIRDIPYRIALNPDEQDSSCLGKAKKLLTTFLKMGYEARYRVGTFHWSDLDLPSFVTSFPHEELATHVYVEAKINGEWRVLDPTWDKGLEKVLMVNEWDGESDTEIAVPILELFSPKKSAKIMEESTNPKLFEEDMNTNGAFYAGFNDWLVKRRGQK